MCGCLASLKALALREVLRGLACAFFFWIACAGSLARMLSHYNSIIFWDYHNIIVSSWFPSTVSCLLFPVSVSCLLSPVSCLLSPVSCLLSPVSCLLSPSWQSNKYKHRSQHYPLRPCAVLRRSCAGLAWNEWKITIVKAMVVVYAAHLARPCAEHLARKFGTVFWLTLRGLAQPCAGQFFDR